MIGIYRKELLEQIREDPMWKKALDEAYDEWVRTGKMSRLAAVVEDYCESKGIKFVKL